jgi:hypothetical protein
VTIDRVVVYDFEDGAPGSPFTPGAAAAAYHARSDYVYANPGGERGVAEFDLSNTPGVDPQYSSEAAIGSRSLYFPPYLNGSAVGYLWSALPSLSPVCGIEVTFKTNHAGLSSVSTDCEINLGEDAGVRFDFVDNAIIGAWYYDDPNDPAGFGPNIPVDQSAWLTIKTLPTGEWSLAYTGGATILSGQTRKPPAPTPFGSGHTYFSRLSINAYNQSSGVAPLWIDNIVFWIDPGVPPLTAAFSLAVDASGRVVAFDATGSSSPGTIVNYAWDFGDAAYGVLPGQSSAGVRVDHTYVALRSYDVTLTVTDDSGSTASVTHTVLLESGAIDGDFVDDRCAFS